MCGGNLIHHYLVISMCTAGLYMGRKHIAAVFYISAEKLVVMKAVNQQKFGSIFCHYFTHICVFNITVYLLSDLTFVN